MPRREAYVATGQHGVVAAVGKYGKPPATPSSTLSERFSGDGSDAGVRSAGKLLRAGVPADPVALVAPSARNSISATSSELNGVANSNLEVMVLNFPPLLSPKSAMNVPAPCPRRYKSVCGRCRSRPVRRALGQS